MITEDETSKTVSNTKTSIFNNTIENSDNNFPLVENISDPEEIILNSELDQQIFLGENAFTYVCGYLFKKLRESHNCLMPLPISSDLALYDKYTFIEEKILKKIN